MFRNLITEEQHARILEVLDEDDVYVDRDIWDRLDWDAPLRDTLPDVNSMFYSNAVNMLHGPDGCGKTMMMSDVALQVMARDETVFWLNYEETDAYPLLKLLRSRIDVSITPDLRSKLHVLSANGRSLVKMMPALLDFISDWQPKLIVIDSLGEALACDDVDENRDMEIARWLQQSVRRLAAAGPGVVLIDHATKANDNSMWSAGSKRKRAAITGMAYTIEVPEEQGWSRHRGGYAELRVTKDRFGKYHRGQLAWKFSVQPHPTDEAAYACTFAEYTTEAMQERRTAQQRSFLEMLEVVLVASPGAGKTYMRDGVHQEGWKGTNDQFADRLDEAMRLGKIRMEKGARNRHHYYWVESDMP